MKYECLYRMATHKDSYAQPVRTVIPLLFHSEPPISDQVKASVGQGQRCHQHGFIHILWIFFFIKLDFDVESLNCNFLWIFLMSLTN